MDPYGGTSARTTAGSMPGSSSHRSALLSYASMPSSSAQKTPQPLPVGLQMPEQMQTPATQAPTTAAPRIPPSQVTPQPPRREADCYMTVDSSSSVAATSVAKSAPRTELLTKEQAKVYESE
eukprot:3975068-Pyramimonas_sp.AAC.1